MYIIIQFKINGIILNERIYYYTIFRIFVLNVALIDNIKLK